MKQLLTTGTYQMPTTLTGGKVCHVAKVAGFHSPIIATGERSRLQRFGIRRDYFIGGDGRHRRSEQYRRQPVLRLG